MKNKLLLLLGIFLSLQTAANNMLVQNVTTTGNNAAAKTIQVQFDLSWDNSWRDGINWDAAWIFIKFKDVNGLWQHAQLNPTGFANGSGTANTVKVTSDKVGCWVYRSALGSGTFNASGMQLQWNYGLSGLNDVTGLEVRVFSTEMVYVPEGEFNCGKADYGKFYQEIGLEMGSYNGNLVVNQRLSPSVRLPSASYSTDVFKIKGNTGIDFNNDGVIENSNFPTGYNAFYVMKYEITQQQFVDMLNTCATSVVSQIASEITQYNSGYGMFLNEGIYYTASPNMSFSGFSSERYSAMKNWYGLRQITQLEMNKLSFGPLAPFNISGASPISNAGSLATGQTTFSNSGATYYGVQDIGGNLTEPVIPITQNNYIAVNGNGAPVISNEIYNNGKRYVLLSLGSSSSAFNYGSYNSNTNGYNGSGGANLCNCGSNLGNSEIILEGINTLNASQIKLSFIASKNCYGGKLSLFWSNDGVTWNSLSFNDVNQTNICSQYDVGSSTWDNINLGSAIQLPVEASNKSNIRIKFRFDDNNSSYNSGGSYSHYRIDDLYVSGVKSNGTNTLFFTNFGDFETSDYFLSSWIGGSNISMTKSKSNIINCCSAYSYSSSSYDGFRYCRSAE